MKGFASGVVGVCICMLAIMGTILCGFALGGEEHTTTTTRYDYVTDTTGLFDVSEGKKFTTYSPAANWTGFKESATSTGLGGVTFQASPKINPYPIPVPENQDEEAYFSMLNVTGNADPPGNLSSVTGYIGIADRAYELTGETGVKCVYWPRVVTVQQMYESFLWMQADSGTAVINLVNTAADVSVRAWAAPISAWYEATIKNAVPAWGYVTCQILPLTEYSRVVTLKITPEQDDVMGLDSDGNMVFRSQMSTTTIAYQQKTQETGKYPATTWTGFEDGEATPGYTFKYHHYKPTGTQAYMDITQGVVPDTDPGAYWSNGYQNGRLDMLIRWNESAESTETVLWSWLNVDYTIDGVTTTKKISFEVYYEPVAGNSTSLLILGAMQGAGPQYQAEVKAGAFAKGILVSLDMANDQIVVYALGSFATFEDYALLDTPIATISDFWTDAALLKTSPEPGGITLSSMTLGTTYGKPERAPTIGIVETSVYMGDKALIMDNATIEPLNLWPGHNDVELRFYSFAVLGDELQIIDDEQETNVERFAVSDGKIYVQGILPDGKTTVAGWHTLSNLTIRFTWLEKASQWEIWLVFPDEPGQKPIQTGFTDGDSLTIKLVGYWYVQSAFYEGQNVTTTAYDFDFQRFIFDSNAAILAYMGILIMGTIVAKRMGGLGVYDMIVLVFAGTCGFVLMV